MLGFVMGDDVGKRTSRSGHGRWRVAHVGRKPSVLHGVAHVVHGLLAAKNDRPLNAEILHLTKRGLAAEAQQQGAQT